MHKHVLVFSRLWAWAQSLGCFYNHNSTLAEPIVLAELPF